MKVNSKPAILILFFIYISTNLFAQFEQSAFLGQPGDVKIGILHSWNYIKSDRKQHYYDGITLSGAFSPIKYLGAKVDLTHHYFKPDEFLNDFSHKMYSFAIGGYLPIVRKENFDILIDNYTGFDLFKSETIFYLGETRQHWNVTTAHMRISLLQHFYFKGSLGGEIKRYWGELDYKNIYSKDESYRGASWGANIRTEIGYKWLSIHYNYFRSGWYELTHAAGLTFNFGELFKSNEKTLPIEQ